MTVNPYCIWVQGYDRMLGLKPCLHGSYMIDIINDIFKDGPYDQIIFTGVSICVWLFGDISFMVPE